MPKSPVSAALKAMRNQTGLSVRELADDLGMVTSTYSSYEDKYKKPHLPMELVRKLARTFAAHGIPRRDVLRLGGVDSDDRDASAGGYQEINMEQNATPLATIAELDVRGSAGGGAIMSEDGDAPVIYEWKMPSDLLRSATYAPAGKIKIITVIGDSMEGTFRPFERIMVDISDTMPTPPGIFVVFDGLGLVVKRVEFVPHSEPRKVRITSDNPRYTPYERTLDEAYIQGRVLGRWQWV